MLPRAANNIVLRGCLFILFISTLSKYNTIECKDTCSGYNSKRLSS